MAAARRQWGPEVGSLRAIASLQHVPQEKPQAQHLLRISGKEREMLLLSEMKKTWFFPLLQTITSFHDTVNLVYPSLFLFNSPLVSALPHLLSSCHLSPHPITPTKVRACSLDGEWSPFSAPAFAVTHSGPSGSAASAAAQVHFCDTILGEGRREVVHVKNLELGAISSCCWLQYFLALYRR